MELREYAGILWRGKWLIFLCAFLAVLSALITSNFMTPVYEASTTLLINQAPDSQTSDYTAILISERLAMTYAEMLTTRPVMEETLERLNLTMDLEDLEEAIGVQFIRDTQLIELKVEHTHPLIASELANTIIEVFIEEIDTLQASRFAASKESLRAQLDKLYEQIELMEESIADLGNLRSESGKSELERLQNDLTQYQSTYTSLLQSYEQLRVDEARIVSNVVQVEPATVPLKPVRPQRMLYTLIAAFVGMMIGIGVAFLIEYFDDSLKTPEDVANVLKLPVLASVADSKELKKLGQGPITITEQPLSPLAETFRALRKNIAFSDGDGSPKIIMVASPGMQEGKTTIATNLAVSIAQSGKRVVLVDADLRRPHVHTMLGIPNEAGLSDILQNHRKINDVVQWWKNGHLAVVTGGSLIENPTDILDSDRIVQVLSKLLDVADIVIIDSSPFHITDTWSLVTKVDRLLIVIASGQTHARTALDMFKQLNRAGAKEVGIVLNRINPDRARYYYGSYQDYSSYRGETEA